MLPTHNAGPPPHLALAIAPARNQVLRDELIPCRANIESSLLLNISTSYIEGNTERKCMRSAEAKIRFASALSAKPPGFLCA